MSYQTEVKIGGPLPLAASAAVVALVNPAGCGVIWDAAAANLVISGDDGSPDYIIDEIDTVNSIASVFPFSNDRNFRVRLAASPGAVAVGKYAKSSATLGTFELGGAASDVNVGVFEDSSTAGGAALVRPLAGGTVVT